MNYASVLRRTGRKSEGKKLEARAHTIQAKHGHEGGSVTLDVSDLFSQASVSEKVARHFWRVGQRSFPGLGGIIWRPIVVEAANSGEVPDGAFAGQSHRRRQVVNLKMGP